MKDIKDILQDLESYSETLTNMASTRYTCNELFDFVTGIIAYLRRSGIEDNNRGDTCQNQLQEAIAGISPNAKYGLRNRRSLSIFENAKTDVLWFMGHLIKKLKGE